MPLIHSMSSPITYLRKTILKNKIHFRSCLIALTIIFPASLSLAQDVSKSDIETQSSALPSTVVEVQYEDDGVKVYIPKIFPKYQMQEGQQIAGFLFALTKAAYKKSFQDAGFITDTHRAFHSVSELAAELNINTLMVGTKSQIAAAIERGPSHQNSIVNSLGAVAMFALSRGSSAGAVSNLGAIKDVAGSGMLGAANFRDVSIENKDKLAIEIKDDDLIYIVEVTLKQTQTDLAKKNLIYLVLPKSKKDEIYKDNKWLQFFAVDTSVQNVLSQAIIKTINFIPVLKSEN